MSLLGRASNTQSLFISVEKDSTSWSIGHATVNQCHRILLQHGIDDVNVEMKESRVSLLTSDPSAPQTIPELSAGPVSEPLDINGIFSGHVGQCILSAPM